MTCCIVDNCASCLHCGFACDKKGHHYLQRSWDTSHKTSDLPSLIGTFSFPDSFPMTAVKIDVKINYTTSSLSLFNNEMLIGVETGL